MADAAPILPRSGLVSRLLRVPSRGLGLVVAPTGYGASTLLDLVRREAMQLTVRVDLAHGTTRDFCEQLADALDAAGLRVDRGPGADHRQAVLAALAAAPDVLVLVDDLAAIPDDPAQRDLEGFLAGIPDTVRVVARARRIPTMDLTRLLSGGRLVLVDQGDLVLAPDEARAVVSHLAPGLAPERAEALVALAEGWVGALVAGLLGSGPPDGEAAGSSDPAAWLLGPGLSLLFDPVVDALDPQERELLVATSVLTSLTGPLCDALTGSRRSGDLLRELNARQVVRPLPSGQGAGYAVHGLLREYLRRILQARPGGEEASHAAAGQWYAEHDMAGEAITHLLLAGLVDRAAALLAQRAEELLDRGAAGEVSAWYRFAPQLAVASSDLHLLARAWSEILTGPPREAPDVLAQLQERLELLRSSGSAAPAPDPARGGLQWLSAETALLAASLDVRGGRTARALREVRAARAAFGDDWSRMAHQVAAILEASIHLWLERPAQAGPILSAVTARPGTLSRLRRVELPAAQAELSVQEGMVRRGRRLAEESLQGVAETWMLSPMDTSAAHLALSRALLELEDLAGAADAAGEGIDGARSGGHVTLEVLGLAALAQARAAAGDSRGADDALGTAKVRLAEHEASRELALRLKSAAVRAAVLAGDRGRADDLLAGLTRHLGDRATPSLALQLDVAAMRGSLTEAGVIRLLQGRRPATAREVVALRMAMATALATTRPAEAARHLRSAAELAVEQGQLRALRGRGEELLCLAARIGREPGGAPVQALLTRADPPQPAGIERPDLSPGEQVLLESLAGARGNQEIAAELGISVNTLKTRLRRLYAKLGVHNREEAVGFACRRP